MLDLHTHTKYSDGQLSPKELIMLAKQKNIKILAVTDHDTIAGVCEALDAGQKYGVKVIAGIELSAEYDMEMHILGYNIDIENSELNNACDEFKRFRDERYLKIIKYLEDRNVYISGEDVLKYAEKGIIGRPHFARALIDKGYCETTQEAFDKYLAAKDFKKIERPKPSPEKCIEYITNAGGTAVLAHPFYLKKNEAELDVLLAELVSCGLSGLECYYSTNTEEYTELSLRMAKKHNLIITAGSDYHGEKIKPDISLGIDVDLPGLVL